MDEDVKAQVMAMLKAATDDDVVEVIAETHWKYLNALIRCGFTRAEALQLIVKLPLGVKP